ncbi:MAG: ester cyclase [Thermomicrobiales bacterium]
MVEQNKRIAHRFVEEVINGGNTRLLAEIVSPDHVSHLPLGDHYGPEGVRIDICGFRSAFPDLHLTIESMVGEADYVVYRFVARGTHKGPFMGVPPSGRRIEVDGISMDRLRDGQTIERWLQYDTVALLQQIGSASALSST